MRLSLNVNFQVVIREFEIQGNTFYLLYGKILQPQLVKPLSLSCEAIGALLRETGALMARWVEQLSARPMHLWYVVLTEFHPIEDYQSRVRTYIRSGHKNFVFEQTRDIGQIVRSVISVDNRLAFAQKKNAEEVGQHVRSLPVEYQWWLLKDREGQSLGYVLLYVAGDQVQVRTIHIVERAKRKGAAYFVNYRLSEIFLQDRGVRMIIYGLRSLEHQSNVQQWLEEKMFYSRLYVKIKVCLSPRGKIIYTLFRPMMFLLKSLPFSSIRKIYAFMRFISLAQMDKKE